MHYAAVSRRPITPRVLFTWPRRGRSTTVLYDAGANNEFKVHYHFVQYRQYTQY